MFKIFFFLLVATGLASAGIIADNLKNYPLIQPKPLVRDTQDTPLFKDTIQSGGRSSGGVAYSDTNKPGLAGSGTHTSSGLTGTANRPGLAGSHTSSGLTGTANRPGLAGSHTSSGLTNTVNRPGLASSGTHTSSGLTGTANRPGLASSGTHTSSGLTDTANRPSLAGAGERSSGGFAFSNTNKPGLAGRLVKREADTTLSNDKEAQNSVTDPSNLVPKAVDDDSIDRWVTAKTPEYMCLIYCHCGCRDSNCCTGCKSCPNQHLKHLLLEEENFETTTISL